jgi:hypothetical protein
MKKTSITTKRSKRVYSEKDNIISENRKVLHGSVREVRCRFRL